MVTRGIQSRNLDSSAEPNVGSATTAFVVATWLFVTIVFLFPLKQSWTMSVDANYTRVFVDYSEKDSGEAWTRSAAIATLGLFGLAAIWWPGGHTMRVQGPLAIAWMIFIGWCAVSVLWADSGQQALMHFIGDMCGVVAAFGIASHVSPRQLVRIVFGCTLCWMLLGFAAELSQSTFQPWDPDHRFAGIMHANGMGAVCALLVLSSLYLARRETRFNKLFWATAAVGFVFLYLTHCRTALAAAMFLGIIGLLYLFSYRRAAMALIACTVLVAVAAPLILSNLDDAAASAAAIGRDDSEESSLTARQNIWGELMPYIRESPFCGYSYSFWSEDIELTEPAQSAHSSYIDLTLRFGLIGATLYVVGMLLAVGKSARIASHWPAADCGFLVMLFAFILMSGLLETTIGYTDAFGLFAMCGLCLLAFRDDLDPGAALTRWPQVGVQIPSLGRGMTSSASFNFPRDN